MSILGRILLGIVVAGLAWWLIAKPTARVPMTWDAPRIASLTADLHDADDGKAPADALRGKPVFIYFSANWCGPCRAFTPELCQFYRANGGGTKFEVVFVSADHSAEDMDAYMTADDMPWWGVRHGSASAQALTRAYAGQGIPDLVLLDPTGRVIADSYVDGRYVGPQSVLAAFAAKR